MINWTKEQLMEYKTHVENAIDELRMNKKWYHSFKTKKVLNETEEALKKELDKVSYEIFRRMFIKKI